MNDLDVKSTQDEYRDEEQHEKEADLEIYEKMACWCETNDKEKTK